MRCAAALVLSIGCTRHPRRLRHRDASSAAPRPTRWQADEGACRDATKGDNAYVECMRARGWFVSTPGHAAEPAAEPEAAPAPVPVPPPAVPTATKPQAAAPTATKPSAATAPAPAPVAAPAAPAVAPASAAPPAPAAAPALAPMPARRSSTPEQGHRLELVEARRHQRRPRPRRRRLRRRARRGPSPERPHRSDGRAPRLPPGQEVVPGRRHRGGREALSAPHRDRGSAIPLARAPRDLKV